MGCVVIRNNSQTPIEFDAETASYIKDENIGLDELCCQHKQAKCRLFNGIADPSAKLLSIDPETGVVTATGDFTPDYDAGDREFEIYFK